MNSTTATTEPKPRPEPAPYPSTTELLVDQLRARHWHGLRKYGVTLDRGDLTVGAWIQHHREELLDALGYLQRVEDAAVEIDKQAEEFARKLDELTNRLGNLEAAGDELAEATIPNGASHEKWKAAKDYRPTSVRNPVVRYVDEIPGGMGPDVAVVALRSGHVLEVGDEGVTVWPSAEAQRTGENSQVLGGLTFCKTEAQP